METPEELIERIMQQYAKYCESVSYQNIDQLLSLSGTKKIKEIIFYIAKIYHSETINSYTPNDEQIEKISIEKFLNYKETRDFTAKELYRFGVKKGIELLTPKA